MLIFIGLGLYDERDISVKGLDAVHAADRVYAEFYTSRLMGAAHEKLEAFYGRKIRPSLPSAGGGGSLLDGGSPG